MDEPKSHDRPYRHSPAAALVASLSCLALACTAVGGADPQRVVAGARAAVADNHLRGLDTRTGVALANATGRSNEGDHGNDDDRADSDPDDSAPDADLVPLANFDSSDTPPSAAELADTTDIARASSVANAASQRREPGQRPEPAGARVLIGAGDIATCNLTDDSATARLLGRQAGTVFTAGDDAYTTGTPAQFRGCYGPTWGAVLDRTRPALGNHEYETPGARGYYGFFGAAAGPQGRGWYSYDLDSWHVIVLDSTCQVFGCSRAARQLDWLRTDLDAHPGGCTVAIWHHPRWSSGAHGSDPAIAPFWSALYAAGIEVVINGHDHDYERFAPQDPFGALDRARGIREFVVGTGGAKLREFRWPAVNSLVRNSQTHGVLMLTLRPGRYSWRFLPVAGERFTDSGTARCH
jgi:hypothetical protein